jgi:hypothetical protein
VPIRKWLVCPIPALREKFNPRNINHMPAVEFFVRLDLLDKNEMASNPEAISFEIVLNKVY